jgi:hypothetical protein
LKEENVLKVVSAFSLVGDLYGLYILEWMHTMTLIDFTEQAKIFMNSREGVIVLPTVNESSMLS